MILPSPLQSSNEHHRQWRTAQSIDPGTTLRPLVVEQFKLKPEKVATELNRRLVRAEKYDLPLNEGDIIEIVTFVGGDNSCVIQ